MHAIAYPRGTPGHGDNRRHMIRYAIDASATHTHRFAVTLTVPRPAAEQRLSLPAWIPGSYLLREFARHMSGVVAEQDGKPVSLRQIDKATWVAQCQVHQGGQGRRADGGRPLVQQDDLVLRYAVYAFDPSVRAAFLDAHRGFFNGTSVCLRVEGREHEAHGLGITALPQGWDVATTLPPLDAADGGHAFSATSYDELVDHPVELGRFWRGEFSAGGVPHAFVVAGALPDFDGDRLLAETERICAAEIGFWHGDDERAPFDRYLFLLNAVDEGHGGLEHGSSTALIAPRRNLPRLAAADRAGAQPEMSDGHADLLGLIAHEYFHAWNVKRLKPREFARLDYGCENYTELLWFFEGFTSYYDDRFVRRSGLIDADRYLKLLAKTMTTVAATPGRLAQSVAEASFDAWVKYYRADENTPNATVSYYAKGALVALAFDLTLRSEGHGSLDDVMRRLWSTSGGGPIDEADITAALEAVGGHSYAAELQAWVHGRDELPLPALLERFGVAVDRQQPTLAQRLSIRVGESALTGVKVSHVLHGGAGERAGLAAGDELIALGGWRLRRLDDALRVLPDSGEAALLVSRDQRVMTLPLPVEGLGGGLSSDEFGALQLRCDEAASSQAHALREAWIGG